VRTKKLIGLLVREVISIAIFILLALYFGGVLSA